MTAFRTTTLAALVACMSLADMEGSVAAQTAMTTRLAQRFPPPRPKAPKIEEIRGPKTPSLGDLGASVTVVAFSDYYCPYCRTLSATLMQLHERYPEEVLIVFRHFATSPETEQLAQAALCASEQNQFSAYHQTIFNTRGVGPDSIRPIAEILGMDSAALEQCVSDGRYATRVRDDIREGDRLAIEVTPTLFIDGLRVVGAASFEDLSSRVEEALNR